MTTRRRQQLRIILQAGAIIGNSLLATALLSAAYGGIINPVTTPSGAIIAMAFPIMLLLTITVAVINLIWMRRMAIINGIALLLCAGPIYTFCPLNIFRQSEKSIVESGEQTLKILSFNVFNLYNFSDGNSPDGNQTIDYIFQEDADIVLCQEAAGILTPGNPQVDDRHLEALLGRYPYVTANERGMALLSKYPFQQIDVDFSDKENLDLCRYDLSVDGRTIHIFNVHMQSIGLTTHDKELYRHITEGEASGEMKEIRSGIIAKLSAAFRSRAAQAADVRRAIDATNGTVLLCGDFNDIPGSYATRVVAGDDMTDAYRHAGLGPAITYHADRLYFRIDHMFYRGEIEALRTWTGDCQSSDHYPIIAIFRLL